MVHKVPTVSKVLRYQSCLRVACCQWKLNDMDGTGNGNGHCHDDGNGNDDMSDVYNDNINNKSESYHHHT